jgi:hypothetical protein
MNLTHSACAEALDDLVIPDDVSRPYRHTISSRVARLPTFQSWVAGVDPHIDSLAATPYRRTTDTIFRARETAVTIRRLLRRRVVRLLVQEAVFSAFRKADFETDAKWEAGKWVGPPSTSDVRLQGDERHLAVRIGGGSCFSVSMPQFPRGSGRDIVVIMIVSCD